MVSPLTPLDFLARSATVYRDRIAIVDGERRFTYGEFGERAHRLAAALQALGISAGDRVAVLAFNGVMPLEAHFGPMLIGAVLVILNFRLAAPELAWILKHCGAKVLLVDPELRCLAPSDPNLRIVDDYEALLAGAPAAPVARARDRTRTACIAINYTSGTTGFPKGVMFTHRGAWVNAIGELTEHALDAAKRLPVDAPHVSLQRLVLHLGRHGRRARATFACRGPIRPKSVRLIEAEGVTHLCGAPVVVATLSQYCADRGIRFSRPLRIVTAGAPPTPAVIRAAEETGAQLTHTYGLTETYGPHTICLPKPEWDTLNRRTAGANESAPGSRLPDSRHGSARGGRRHARRPARWRHHGRSAHARQ